MPIGHTEPFNPDDQNWEEYVERLEEFFIANDIAGDKRRATLLTSVGAATRGGNLGGGGVVRNPPEILNELCRGGQGVPTF